MTNEKQTNCPTQMPFFIWRAGDLFVSVMSFKVLIKFPNPSPTPQSPMINSVYRDFSTFPGDWLEFGERKSICILILDIQVNSSPEYISMCQADKHSAYSKLQDSFGLA